MTTLSVVARDLGARGSRAAVASADPAGPLPDAAAQLLRGVDGWWRARATAAGLDGRWLDVAQAVEAAVPVVLLDSGPAEALDRALSAEAVGAAYASRLTAQVRARHGRHYTPAALASELWAMTRRALGHPKGARPLPGLVRDPACGAGALLLPPLREHVTASSRTDPQVALAGLPRLVEGVDADPAAVWLASVLLASELLPLLAAVPVRRRRALPALAQLGDGLSRVPPAAARAVLMNPPYGRVRLSDEDRRRWAGVLYGHANLYALFLAAGLEGLDEQGVLAAVVPTSFTSGLYFSNLRATLASRAPLREAAFVSDRNGVFDGVLQETCLAVFARRKPRKTSITSLSATTDRVARVASPRGAAPWLLPRRSDDAAVAAAAATMTQRLVDVGYRCSTGPLVWNRRQDDLHIRPASDRVPVLWAADLDGGRLHRDPARDRLRYLQLRGADAHVLVMTQPAVLVQRTTSPEQLRRLVATELAPGDLEDWGGRIVVENHVNVLRPTVETPILTRATLARVLATRTLDQVLRCLSGSVAVSAYELESLPMPDVEVLRNWNDLAGAALEAAVAAAYRPGGAA